MSSTYSECEECGHDVFKFEGEEWPERILCHQCLKKKEYGGLVSDSLKEITDILQIFEDKSKLQEQQNNTVSLYMKEVNKTITGMLSRIKSLEDRLGGMN